MAAGQGAHITSTATTGDDGTAPSIFEVLAQENLMTALRPALKHVARITAERNPSRYGWLFVYSDEIYTLLDFILQRHYLKEYNASFAENFYGIKRVPVNDVSSKLSSSIRKKSLILLVLLPYIKLKCDALYEKWKERYRESPGRLQKLKSRLVKVFLTVYPVVHALWESCMLYYQMAYIFGKTRVHSPLLKLAGVILQNLSMEDIQEQLTSKSPSVSFYDRSFVGKLYHISSTGIGGFALVLSSGLSVGVFFLQFLEWWYSSDQNTAALTALPVPDVPQKLTVEGVPKLPTVCPLCLRFRTNDTTLAVSGYVFCYPCIYKYVSENQCCPVTKYPANTDHLVKLYKPDG